MSVAGTFYYMWQGNLTATLNHALSRADYDPFCATAPADSALPGGGIYQVCGLYNLNPAYLSIPTHNDVVFANSLGNHKGILNVTNGFQFNTHGTFGKGGFVTGGFEYRRILYDSCGTLVINPQPSNPILPFGDALSSQLPFERRVCLPLQDCRCRHLSREQDERRAFRGNPNRHCGDLVGSIHGHYARTPLHWRNGCGELQRAAGQSLRQLPSGLDSIRHAVLQTVHFARTLKIHSRARFPEYLQSSGNQLGEYHLYRPGGSCDARAERFAVAISDWNRT